MLSTTPPMKDMLLHLANYSLLDIPGLRDVVV